MDHKHFWRGLIKPRSKTFLLPLLGIHVLLFSHSTYAALNGMAVLNTFGKEKYIAALYVDTPTNNANSVFLQSNSASMEFLVVDRSISRRSMGRLWAESVAINADYTLFEKYAEDLVSLTNLIKGRLVTGDKLRLTRTDVGVALELNDLSLGELESDGLFELLLQTWIGEVPPSTQFKEQLLASGDIDPQLQSRFQALSPPEGRIQQITNNWLAPPETPESTAEALPEAETVAETAVAAATTKEPESEAPPQSSQQQQVSEAPSVAAETEIASTEPEPEVEAPAVAETTAEPTPAATVEETVEEEIAEATSVTATFTPAPEQDAVSSPFEPGNDNTSESPTSDALQVASLSPATSISDAEEPTEVLSAEDLLAGQRYYSQVISAIYKNVQYPVQALRAGREGNVGLEIAVAADGELVDTAVSQKSGYRLLDREAARAVKKISPFPKPPQSLLEDDQYQFKLVVRFKLRE
ncbi:TonB family protein [Sessilibacter corallicola]|uniref:TonB family protein n=1 Tax=Sessilibacter corallicola TaxID=2904075 RepID=UPI001E52AAE3|nr:TonB family protein [Sessilibacter corallicola]MCE2030505.1 TonB family protein [Sessilibacter corallicola]